MRLLYHLALLLGATAGDHYHTLGLRRRASQKQIKKAYRDLAKQHHPDKGGDPEKFKDIQKAFDILGNEQKRETYDLSRRIRTRAPTAAERRIWASHKNRTLKWK